jgi:hypothetical protein
MNNTLKTLLVRKAVGRARTFAESYKNAAAVKVILDQYDIAGESWLTKANSVARMKSSSHFILGFTANLVFRCMILELVEACKTGTSSSYELIQKKKDMAEAEANGDIELFSLIRDDVDFLEKQSTDSPYDGGEYESDQLPNDRDVLVTTIEAYEKSARYLFNNLTNKGKRLEFEVSSHPVGEDANGKLQYAPIHTVEEAIEYAEADREEFKNRAAQDAIAAAALFKHMAE